VSTKHQKTHAGPACSHSQSEKRHC
jgi:hypothetical protein